MTGGDVGHGNGGAEAAGLGDIKEREDAAREANRRVQLVFDTMTFACVFWTPDAEIIDCNRRAVELFECGSKEEFLANFYRFSPEYQPDGKLSVQKARDVIIEAGRRGKKTFNWEHITAAGNPLAVHVALMKVKWDDDFRVIGYLRDISSLRKAEEDLALMSSIVKYSPNCAIGMDEAGTIEYTNQAVTEQTGYSHEELCLRGMELLFSPGDFKRFKEEYLSLVKEKGSLKLETEITRKDGERRIFAGHLFAIKLSGKSYNIAYSASDVTGERGITRELEEAKLAAEASAQAKSSFLARMSHEIRTPMNAIIGMTELILREDAPDIVREHALAVKQAGRNLLAIINDILDFSRIESGKMEMVPVEYKTASVINDVISITRVRINEKPVAFTADIEASFPETLYGDEVRVRQILLNLISNAVKFTKEGSISLGISHRNADGAEAVVTFEVKDTGMGIKQEDIHKLFTDFARLDTHKNLNVEGTGLGLAISRRLCRSMGGDITVASEYGRGSVFTATIRQGIKSCTPLARVQEPASKKVLVYENDDRYAASAAYSLKSLNVPFTLAANEGEFKKALAEDDFAFVFISSVLAGCAGDLTGSVKNARIVLVAEHGESLLAMRSSGALTVFRPIHTILIANVLNGADSAGLYVEEAAPELRFTAPEARILVVDDVLSNLKVIEGLLEPFGMAMDFCLDGKEAVSLVKKNNYDFVLMDHMMPGMDGVETTAAIRALPGEKYRRLPVIALTANAVSGMKEMFLRNGFNDYISKPVEIARLYKMVEKWIPRSKREKLYAPVTSPALRGEAASPGFEIPGVDTVYGLAMSGGREKIYREALSLFRRDAEARSGILEHAPEAADLSSFITCVHALKGASAGIGAAEISRIAKSLEEAGREGDIAAIAEQLPGFRASLEALTRGIEEALERETGEKGSRECGGGARSPDREALSLLLAALKRGNVHAADGILSGLMEKSPGEREQRGLSEISGLILLSEFGEAVKKTEALLAGKE